MLLPLARYADFRGRSRRREFWLWVLFNVGAYALLGWADEALGLSVAGDDPFARLFAPISGLLSFLYGLATLLPSLAVTVRRLHDTDRRWWWMLLPIGGTASMMALAFLFAEILEGPALGLIMVLLFFGSPVALLALLCVDGTRGPNRFGPDPKDPAGTADLAEVFR